MSPGQRVVFTAAEQQHIDAWLSLHKEVAMQDTPEGMIPIVPQGVRDGLVAFALRDYVNELTKRRKESASASEIGELFRLSLSAQTKVIAISTIPIYRFELACMYEAAKDTEAARTLFNQFLREQAAFRPSPEDSIFLAQIPYEMSEVIRLAIERSL